MNKHDDAARADAAEVPFDVLVERTRARIATEARDQLISAVAHDLRSPLNGIQGWAHVLERRLDAESPLVQRALGGIKSAVQQQVQMIDDLADTMHVMAGAMSLQPGNVALRPTVDAAVADCAEAAAARHLSFVVAHGGEDLQAWADPARCSQALRYLFAHLVRIALEGDRIDVALRRADDMVEVVAGSAAPEVDVAALPPARGVKTPAAVALACRLIELQGGAISAAPVDADGVRERYRIRLPAADHGTQADELEQRALAAARAQVSLEHLRVWLLEGAQAPALRRQLAGLGLAPTVFTDVAAMLERSGSGDSADVVLAPLARAGELTRLAGRVPCLAYAGASEAPPGVVANALAVVWLPLAAERLAATLLAAAQTGAARA